MNQNLQPEKRHRHLNTQKAAWQEKNCAILQEILQNTRMLSECRMDENWLYTNVTKIEAKICADFFRVFSIFSLIKSEISSIIYNEACMSIIFGILKESMQTMLVGEE